MAPAVGSLHAQGRPGLSTSSCLRPGPISTSVDACVVNNRLAMSFPLAEKIILKKNLYNINTNLKLVIEKKR